MTRAQLLKRVFYIDAETCRASGGAVKVIASIEDPMVIGKILTHLDETSPATETICLPECRASPQTGLFDDVNGTCPSDCRNYAAGRSTVGLELGIDW